MGSFLLMIFLPVGTILGAILLWVMGAMATQWVAGAAFHIAMTDRDAEGCFAALALLSIIIATAWFESGSRT